MSRRLSRLALQRLLFPDDQHGCMDASALKHPISPGFEWKTGMSVSLCGCACVKASSRAQSTRVCLTGSQTRTMSSTRAHRSRARAACSLGAQHAVGGAS
jgi:hypothetical protein